MMQEVCVSEVGDVLFFGILASLNKTLIRPPSRFLAKKSERVTSLSRSDFTPFAFKMGNDTPLLILKMIISNL
jgi:hypothetical protein